MQMPWIDNAQMPGQPADQNMLTAPMVAGSPQGAPAAGQPAQPGFAQRMGAAMTATMPGQQVSPQSQAMLVQMLRQRMAGQQGQPGQPPQGQPGMPQAGQPGMQMPGQTPPGMLPQQTGVPMA